MLYKTVLERFSFWVNHCNLSLVKPLCSDFFHLNDVSIIVTKPLNILPYYRLAAGKVIKACFDFIKENSTVASDCCKSGNKFSCAKAPLACQSYGEKKACLAYQLVSQMMDKDFKPSNSMSLDNDNWDDLKYAVSVFPQYLEGGDAALDAMADYVRQVVLPGDAKELRQ